MILSIYTKLNTPTHTHVHMYVRTCIEIRMVFVIEDWDHILMTQVQRGCPSFRVGGHGPWVLFSPVLQKLPLLHPFVLPPVLLSKDFLSKDFCSSTCPFVQGPVLSCVFVR